MDRLRRYGLRMVVAAAVVAGAWFALRGVSASQIVRAVSRTDVAMVMAFGLPLLAASSVLRTARFQALLPVFDNERHFATLWSAVLSSNAGNNVFPLRAGELLRTRETVAAGYPLRQVAVAQVAEKAIEAGTLVVCASPALATRVGSGGLGLLLLALLCVAGMLAVWGARRFRIAPKQFLISVVWSFLADAVELAIIAVCLRGVGLPAGLASSAAVFAAVNIAIALPSTPGNLGAFEAGAALPLIAMGAEHDAAVAFACVYRVVQWLPVTLAGAALWAKRAAASPGGRARAS